jgi:hypothetical protein
MTLTTPLSELPPDMPRTISRLGYEAHHGPMLWEEKSITPEQVDAWQDEVMATVVQPALHRFLDNGAEAKLEKGLRGMVRRSIKASNRFEEETMAPMQLRQPEIGSMSGSNVNPRARSYLPSTIDRVKELMQLYALMQLNHGEHQYFVLDGVKDDDGKKWKSKGLRQKVIESEKGLKETLGSSHEEKGMFASTVEHFRGDPADRLLGQVFTEVNNVIAVNRAAAKIGTLLEAIEARHDAGMGEILEEALGEFSDIYVPPLMAGKSHTVRQQSLSWLTGKMW